MTDPSPKSIAYAIHLKESANDLKQTIDSLSGDNNDLFSMKSAYSDNEALASVEYEPEDAEEYVPMDFTLEVEKFASPPGQHQQIHAGKPACQPHAGQLFL